MNKQLFNADRHAAAAIDDVLKNAENTSDAALNLRATCEAFDAVKDWDLAEAIFAELINRGSLLNKTSKQ